MAGMKACAKASVGAGQRTIENGSDEPIRNSHEIERLPRQPVPFATA